MVKARPRLTQRAFLAGCLVLVPLLPLALMQGKAAPKELESDFYQSRSRGQWTRAAL